MLAQRPRLLGSFLGNGYVAQITARRVAARGAVLLILLLFVPFHASFRHDVEQTGMSPLAPGQWKPFLAVYAGLWVVTNFMRPIRVAAAVAISPKFDHALAGFQNRFKVNKAVAIGMTVFMANVVIVSALFVVSIGLAALLSGTPIWPATA